MRAIDFYAEKIKDFESMDFEQRRYWVEHECLEKSKMHTKKTLKGLFRVKPKPDAVVAGSYTNDYKMEINLYHYDQCIPMRNASKKPRSEAQKAATAKLLANTPKGKAIAKCQELVNSSAIVIDTETTSLDGVAIQIAAVCCATRKVLYSSLIFTTQEISEGAFDVHGITAEMLKDAPTAEVVAAELQAVIADHPVVAFNASFDKEICFNTFGSEPFVNADWLCAMREIAVPTLGSTNRHGTISLRNATYYAGVEWTGEAHNAEADALATVDLIRKLGERDVHPE